jgi:hypothetical protein
VLDASRFAQNGQGKSAGSGTRMKRGKSSSRCNYTIAWRKNKPGGQRPFARSGEQFLGCVGMRNFSEDAPSGTVATCRENGCRLGSQRGEVAPRADHNGRRKVFRCSGRGRNERGNAFGCHRRVKRREILWRNECGPAGRICRTKEHRHRTSSGGSTRQAHAVVLRPVLSFTVATKRVPWNRRFL